MANGKYLKSGFSFIEDNKGNTGKCGSQGEQ